MATERTRRAIGAEATQRAIVESASRLFTERGYTGTSISEIAEDAGVAIQTVYNSVGSKRDVLSRVLDFAAAGDRAPVPVPAFMSAQAEAETDPGRILDQLVDFWRGAMERVGPVNEVIRQAAALDPEVAELQRRRTEQRLRNYEIAAGILADRGALRKGLSLEEAAAIIHSVGHPDAYRFLVSDQGWGVDRWAGWVRSTLAAALFEPPA